MEFPIYSRIGITIVEGCGYQVKDSEGRTYFDFYGGHAVATLGYRHPGLTKAITDQVKKLHFQTNAVDLDIRSEACSELVSIAPPCLDAVFFVNSGAEANENALRIAFWRTARQRVVALKGAFHGRTAAAGAVTYGNSSWYGFPRLPFEVDWVTPNDIVALDTALNEETAAFIYEPVQGVAGAISLNSEFLERARLLCDQRGIVMIADEVQTGMGRLGTFFSDVIVPDLLTTAKGLGAGFPTAAVFAQSEWAAEMKTGSLGTTFGGGPVACAAIVAVVRELKKPGFLENVRHISSRLKNETTVGPVHSVTGSGLLLGLRCSRPASEVRAELLNKGFLTGDAKDPAIVRLLPPLIIDDFAVDAFVAALREIPA